MTIGSTSGFERAREWRPASATGALTALASRAWHAAYRLAYWGLRVYWWLFFVRTAGVYVAVWVGDEVLLIRNSYRGFQSLPGGGVARGEDRASAAARELAEEVGISVEPGSLGFAGTYTAVVHHQTDDASVFELAFESPPDVKLDGREVVWAGLCDLETALTRNLAPVVRLYLESRRSEIRASRA